MAQVEVGDLQADRLRGAQPARVHHLEQRPVASAGRPVAARRRQQPLDLPVVEDLGKLLRLPRRRSAPPSGRRSIELLAAQMAGRRSAGTPPCGGSSPAEHGRAAVPASPGRPGTPATSRGRAARALTLAPREELAVLEQVGAVGVEGVAGQPALQLQVSEEVEHETPRSARPTGSPAGRPGDGDLP